MSDAEIKKLVRTIKNEYHRNWQRQNPEKVKKAQDKYWLKKVQEIQKGSL